jgi:predicted regulator of Ras-like GTPase activity (Roadblock/LC7/MglB family)
MDKKEIEPKLAKVMDAVTECEGLIFAKTSGEVIVGQTLTEMDHKAIAKSASLIAKTDIGKSSLKGNVSNVTVDLEKGFLLIMVKGDNMVIGLLGADGKNAVGLLIRQLKLLI